MFRPIIVDSLKDYNRKQLLNDISSGLIVGIVAVPLCIAFAIATGVSPEKGLITAFIASIIVALMGGCRFQIMGPTGAFAVILIGVVQKHGLEGLATATLMAGAMQIIMGLLRLGSVVKFIPYPVVIGFTGGVAAIIFTLQIRDLVGFSVSSPAAGFVGKWVEFVRGVPQLNWHALILSAVGVLIMILWPRVNRRVPGALVAILASVAIARIFGLNVETVGSRFGDIPSAFPLPVMPNFDYAVVMSLFLPALSIALLGSIEGLLSATVADEMSGTKHRSNMELSAFGVANMLSPLFGGIAATGAVARTAANIRSGGRTPIAAISHAFVLLLVVLCLGQWVKLIPLCALAAVLAMVAYGMSEWRKFAAVLKRPPGDAAVLLTTFTLTLLVNLTVAVFAGGALAAILFIFKKIRTPQTKAARAQRDAVVTEKDA